MHHDSMLAAARRPRSTLDCPICLSLLTDPVVARCGHSFCSPCLNAYLGFSNKRRRDSPCPVCESTLADATVYPSVALSALVDRARGASRSANPDATAVDVGSLPDQDADRLLRELLHRKRAKAAARANVAIDIIVPFLEKCRREKRHELDNINHDLCLIDSDLNHLQTKRHLAPDSDLQHHFADAGVVPPDTAARNLLIAQHHDNVKSAYFDRRRTQGHSALSSVMDMLVDATSISSVRKHAAIHHIDILRTNHSLVSSIDFNSTATLFATAGATKLIKVFDFQSLFDAPTSSTTSPAHHYPILEIPHSSKLSCVSWSRERSFTLAAATHKGDILIHETETNTRLSTLTGHSKRAWFVDFSSSSPSLLLSGSDDNTVKLWDVDRQLTSTMTVQTSANVCCVKFNPFDPNEFAFGSADHNVYSYDLRYPKAPRCVFQGHWRAVSHVLFLNRSELVSASTDSSCKLWNVEKQQPGLSYAGHTNERNFVGLSGSKDFFVCGSEDNSVYFYHKGFAGPVAKYKFDSERGFVSTVSWKPHSPWIVAATNSGSVEILKLV